MAQYGQGYYGEMYYGVLGAKFGTYYADTLRAAGNTAFIGDMVMIVTLEDIKKNYKTKTQSLSQVDLFTFNLGWTDTGTNYRSNVADAKFTFEFTGSNCSLVYSGGPINYTITTADENGVRTVGSSGSLPSNGTLTERVIPSDSYANYSIEFTCPINTTIDSGNVFVCGTKPSIKSSTSTAGLSTAQYVDLPILSQTVSPIQGNKFQRKTTYDASILRTKSIYEYKLMLLSSDSSVDVYVTKVEIQSKDPLLFMPRCTYIQTVDLLTVLGSDMYARINDMNLIVWTENAPAGTKIGVRTSAGSDPVNIMSDYSPSYRMGSVQARLKPNSTYGWVLTPVFDYNVYNGLHNTTTQARVAEVNIKHSLSTTHVDRIYGLMYSVMSDLEEKFPIRVPPSEVNVLSRDVDLVGKKGQVLIELYNRQLNFSPTIDSVDMLCHCEYSETKNKSGTMLSAVEQEKVLSDLNSFNFKVGTHPYISNANYTINNNSGSWCTLYFNSTEGINRSGSVILSKNANDNIAGYSRLDISVSRRLQNVRFGEGTIEADKSQTFGIRMINNFTSPDLDRSDKYLFRVESGVVNIDRSSDMNKLIIDQPTVAAKTSFKFQTPYGLKNQYTAKSVFNDEPTNDIILLNTMFEGDADTYEWVSEERSATATINPLGEKQDLIIEMDRLPNLDPQVFFNNRINVDYTTNPQKVLAGAYEFNILENSVFCVPKAGSRIPVSKDRIKITNVELVDNMSNPAPTASVVLTRGIKHYYDGIIPNADEIPALSVTKIISVRSLGTPSTSYSSTSWSFDTTNPNCKTIVWIAGRPQPAVNEQYIVTYEYRPKAAVKVTLQCDHSETAEEKSGWTSKHRYKVSDICRPGENKVIDLTKSAPTNNINIWPDIDPGITPNTLKYIVYSCDNEYVQCRIDDSKLMVGMSGINPMSDWMLKMNSGFYYLGKDEHYKYIEKQTVNVSQNIPVISDAEYTAGANINSGAIVSHDIIKSIALNNDFKNNTIGLSSAITPDSTYIFMPENQQKVFWL